MRIERLRRTEQGLRAVARGKAGGDDFGRYRHGIGLAEIALHIIYPKGMDVPAQKYGIAHGWLGQRIDGAVTCRRITIPNVGVTCIRPSWKIEA
jgi:hypothetical protein